VRVLNAFFGGATQPASYPAATSLPRASHGVKGFYPGGTAIAFRQATNWASRQGFTEGVRSRCAQLRLQRSSLR
jgi:hypothetical protein